MAKVTILVEGYARPKGSYYEASPSTVLIEDGGKKILVDPGCNKELLLAAMRKHNMSVNDIDYIFLTHYHVDHWLNVRLFPNTDVLDGDVIWKGDKEISYSKYLPGTSVEIIQTPGHAYEEVSLLVGTVNGIIAIAADVFWWEDGKQRTDAKLTKKYLLDFKDIFVKDAAALKRSRKLVLSKADWIIPGHGKMFRVPKK